MNTAAEAANVNKQNTAGLSNVNVKLTAVKGTTVAVSLILSVADHVPLNDWCQLHSLQCSIWHEMTLQDGLCHTSKQQSVKTRLLCSLSNQRETDNDIDIPASEYLSHTIPLYIIVAGHEQLISAFDFLLSKRVMVKDNTQYLIPYDINIHYQPPLKDTLRDYFPGCGYLIQPYIAFSSIWLNQVLLVSYDIYQKLKITTEEEQSMIIESEKERITENNSSNSKAKKMKEKITIIIIQMMIHAFMLIIS